MNLSQIANQSPQVTTLLMMRGAGLPPVVWSDNPNAAASQTLNNIEDAELFGRPQIKSDSYATAIRSLLFLYNGWMSEASMLAMGCDPELQHYIAGLAERHLGRADAAKTAFQQLDGHPIHKQLVSVVDETTRSSADKQIRRFADIVNLNDSWEAFAFIDLLEEAREGQLTSAAERIVRQLQKQEFDALLWHCYGNAVVVPETTPENASRRSDAAEARRRMEATRAKHAPTKRSTPEPAEKRKGPLIDLGSDVRVGCPKCKHVHAFAPDKRGSKQPCIKCGATFLVPGGKGKHTAGNSGEVHVTCPKCKTRGSYSEAKRGEKVQCNKCAAAFMIPKRSAA